MTLPVSIAVGDAASERTRSDSASGLAAAGLKCRGLHAQDSEQLKLRSRLKRHSVVVPGLRSEACLDVEPDGKIEQNEMAEHGGQCVAESCETSDIATVEVSDLWDEKMWKV